MLSRRTRYLKYITVQKLTPAGLKRVGPHVEACCPRRLQALQADGEVPNGYGEWKRLVQL